MKSKIKYVLTALSASLLAGCNTTGLSPREQGANRYSELVYGFCEQQDQTTGESKPIQRPMRLGVAQIGETAPPKELVNELKKHHTLISDIIELPLAGDQENRWNYRNAEEDNSDKIRQQAKTLRALGQQLGADYILVIGGNIDSHVEANLLQVFDLVIVPGMILPSQKIDMNTRVGGAFINAETGRLEFLLTTTSESTNYSPSFYIDQKIESMAIDQKITLIRQLSDELINRLIESL